MASFCSVVESTSSSETHRVLHAAPRGTHKIHYQPSSDWDFILDTQEITDMSLVLPHYRARHQPVDQRLNMYVGAAAAPVKLKVCRPVPRCKFYLEVQAKISDVTVWLPSDFKGQIRHSGRASYSAGFVNRIKQNVCLNEDTLDQWDIDEVVIETTGTVTFRMWDVWANAPENIRKETLKRMFCQSAKKHEGICGGINWDFLLDD
ncbi:hypothetical protein L210DRAFT_3455970 [Boletus edulis BED1]|uniref:DUF7330 domain-containing protein n=1 Tax=Boletus edulis BED1 TaxID=1328754 RepID=A0AAD4BJD9_BOLED|nr:hypothetical protein L210DRAFT_3455970 [Boletus edulis BED1]